MVERSGLGAEIAAGPGLDPRRAVPPEAIQPLADRMEAKVPGDRGDGASDDDWGYVDAAQLQPLGGSNIVGVLPGAREGCGSAIPGQRLVHDNALGEVVEGKRAGEGHVRGERDADIRLVALGTSR
jgi:hypothetical protein